MITNRSQVLPFSMSVYIGGLSADSSGSRPWMLAVGVIIWLVAAAVTLTGFIWSRHDLPEPRPGFWSMRFMLIHDTFSLGRHSSGRDASSS